MPSVLRRVLVPATVSLIVAAGAVLASPASASSVWPSAGQAAYRLGSGPLHVHNQHVAPIASMAKVMTAYVVLRAHPLPPKRGGFTMTVTQRDVDDYRLRVSRGESTVPVRLGEKLTERQALAALLLPSANNIAIMLARRTLGSVARFVTRMNRSAHDHGMRHTRYTDPSGFDAATRSQPGDQLVIMRLAMRLPAFRGFVARSSYPVPVAGTVYNTDTLLGTDGFIGVKTGSMDASGGCFMFVSRRIVKGHVVELSGVVMGQPGNDLIRAGLDAARRLVDRVAPHAAAH